MEFEYEAVDANGRTLKGELEAPSAAEVVRRLSQDGQTAVNVSERKPQALPALRRRLRGADVVVAFHELATLLQSGVALGDAVVAQSRGSYHPTLAAAFDGIARDLMRGHSFLEAIRASDLPLPDYVYHLVEAGEMSGRLPQSLREGVDQMTYDQRVASEIRGALTYPAILVLSSIVAVVLVFVFVVPKFSNLLEGGNELPLFSEIVPAHRRLVQRQHVADCRRCRRRRTGPRRRAAAQERPCAPPRWSGPGPRPQLLAVRERHRQVGVGDGRDARQPRGVDRRLGPRLARCAHQPPSRHARARRGRRQKRQRPVRRA